MDKAPKKSTAREVTEAAIEASAGMVPVVGSPLAAAFALAMGWSFNQRMQQWLDDLAEAVTDLQERTDGLSFEELAEDDSFVDAVVSATRAAQATHQQAKLTALRNGVLNSLNSDAAALDEHARFFRLVEQFTPGHLALLAFLDDPGAVFDHNDIPRPQLMGGGRGHLLEKAMPELAGQRDWYDLLAADLASTSLAQPNLHTMMTGGGLWQSSTTPLGKRFLRFISDPATSDVPT